MKIGNSINQELQNAEASKSKGIKSDDITTSKQKKSSSILSSSKLNVSEKAQRMSDAKDIASENTVNEAKIARIQQIIDEGSYHVSSEAIANKLVDEHLKLN